MSRKVVRIPRVLVAEGLGGYYVDDLLAKQAESPRRPFPFRPADHTELPKG